MPQSRDFLALSLPLKDLGHDVHTVGAEDLVGHSDREIWEAAQKHSRFLITQDMDFLDSRKFVPGTHRGFLLLRLNSPNRRSLVRRIVELFQEESVGGWAGCFVVAPQRKTRVLKPGQKQNS